MRAAIVPVGRVRFESASEVLCARCHSPMERHQPDLDRPERMLGTCADCGAWFLIDGEARVMYALPDTTSLRRSS